MVAPHKLMISQTHWSRGLSHLRLKWARSLKMCVLHVSLSCAQEWAWQIHCHMAWDESWPQGPSREWGRLGIMLKPRGWRNIRDYVALSTTWPWIALTLHGHESGSTNQHDVGFACALLLIYSTFAHMIFPDWRNEVMMEDILQRYDLVMISATVFCNSLASLCLMFISITSWTSAGSSRGLAIGN